MIGETIALTKIRKNWYCGDISLTTLIGISEKFALVISWRIKFAIILRNETPCCKPTRRNYNESRMDAPIVEILISRQLEIQIGIVTFF